MTLDEFKKTEFNIPFGDKESRERFVKSRAERVIFATISACADKSLFVTDGVFNERACGLYNERNDGRLTDDLKSVGFDYQRLTGGWCDGIGDIYLVWNNCYEWENFFKVILKLNELYKQWDICIGRYINDTLEISYWVTDEINGQYIQTAIHTTDSVSEALNNYSGALLKKYYKKTDGLSNDKAVTLGELQRSGRLAAEGTVMGEYGRRALIESLYGLNSYMPATLWGPDYTIQDALREHNKLADKEQVKRGEK